MILFGLETYNIQKIIISIFFSQLFNHTSYLPLSYLKSKGQNIILLVVLYRCKTWSLTVQEVFRVKVFENKVQRRTFGTKK